MPKKIIGYWIISFLILTVMFLYIEKLGSFSFLIVLTLMLYGRYLIRSERNKVGAISYKYLMECDPYECIESFKKYYKKVFQSKRQKNYVKMVYAIILIDAGQIDNSIDILCSLDVDVNQMSDIERFWYLRAWAQIYYEKNQPEHMKKMLDEITLLIDRADQRIVNTLKENYNLLLAKYYILTEVYLDNSLDILEKCFRENHTAINRIKSIFYIGLINLKKNNYEKAKQCFTDVVKTKRTKLKVYNDSEKIISKLFTDKSLTNC